MLLMTFNLRFENDTDGDNHWRFRRDVVVDVIRRYQPDILGTQEGKWTQLNYLREQLPEYAAFLAERVPDETIQCPTLFFRREAIEVESGGDFWLSTTPNQHLSKDWDSAFPRMLSFAAIRHKKFACKLMAAVTHLDHVGVIARHEQAKIIGNWAGKQTRPVVLLGDFNDAPGSDAHVLLTGPATRLQDTWKAVKGTEDAGSYTHHGFTGRPAVSRMDWILVDNAFTVNNACILQDSFNGRFPSDHFPYMADIEPKENP